MGCIVSSQPTDVGPARTPQRPAACAQHAGVADPPVLAQPAAQAPCDAAAAAGATADAAAFAGHGAVGAGDRAGASTLVTEGTSLPQGEERSPGDLESPVETLDSTLGAETASSEGGTERSRVSPLRPDQERRQQRGGDVHRDGDRPQRRAPSRTDSQQRLKSKYQVPFEEIVFHETIGKGGFKTVFRGRWNNTNVAIMRMRRGGMVTEARLMQRLSTHPNLVQFYRWAEDGAGNEYIIVELVAMGGLDKILVQFGGFLRTSHKLAMAEQVCSALDNLAREGVLHRDLAVRNVLVQSLDPVYVKVADFGLSRDINRRTSRATMSELPVRWAPPEVLLRQEWSEKSDVWAFGVTLWELFSNGSEPYARLCDQEVVTAVLAGERLERPAHCPREVYALMQDCWRLSPAERPPFAQIAARFRTWREAHAGAGGGGGGGAHASPMRRRASSMSNSTAGSLAALPEADDCEGEGADSGGGGGQARAASPRSSPPPPPPAVRWGRPQVQAAPAAAAPWDGARGVTHTASLPKAPGGAALGAPPPARSASFPSPTPLKPAEPPAAHAASGAPAESPFASVASSTAATEEVDDDGSVALSFYNEHEIDPDQSSVTCSESSPDAPDATPPDSLRHGSPPPLWAPPQAASGSGTGGGSGGAPAEARGGVQMAIRRAAAAEHDEYRSYEQSEARQGRDRLWGPPRGSATPAPPSPPSLSLSTEQRAPLSTPAGGVSAGTPDTAAAATLARHAVSSPARNPYADIHDVMLYSHSGRVTPAPSRRAGARNASGGVGPATGELPHSDGSSQQGLP